MQVLASTFATLLLSLSPPPIQLLLTEVPTIQAAPVRPGPSPALIDSELASAVGEGLGSPTPTSASYELNMQVGAVGPQSLDSPIHNLLLNTGAGAIGQVQTTIAFNATLTMR